MQAGEARATDAAPSCTVGASPMSTALAFPSPAPGWLLGQAAAGGRAEIWRTGTAGATWQDPGVSAGSPLSVTSTHPSHPCALIPLPTGQVATSTAGGGTFPPPTAGRSAGETSPVL